VPAWNINDMPDQTGRIAVITGATSGLGTWCARGLAARGAEVILAVRNTEKGEATARSLRKHFPLAKLTVLELNLTSLASIWHFALRASDTLPRIDMLINNAGLGLQPQRIETEDGFEQQFGVNFLGHFALTARLVPSLLRAPAPRVVTVASIAHRRGAINWEDPNQHTGYRGRFGYNQSKLACLMFALELAARATEQHSRLASIPAHPGLALTGMLAASGLPGYIQAGGLLATRILGQSAEAGARPLLYAATMPDANNGDYWGPDGIKEIRGNPARATVWPHARNRPDWQRLWSTAESLTKLTFPALT
jgi:NAD(P)-dependent dehydrogenase (short-subunit alcohol dehydrogenase family)